jgi:hypothetical protein
VGGEACMGWVAARCCARAGWTGRGCPRGAGHQRERPLVTVAGGVSTRKDGTTPKMVESSTGVVGGRRRSKRVLQHL